ncbi:hypothetical protein [Nocardia aurea]|uniref:DUF3558 domain-containing protein n=1 Tax=Nocardia aurea TaxID=2144174 RepID=A0ABV3G256_9NOCA
MPLATIAAAGEVSMSISIWGGSVPGGRMIGALITSVVVAAGLLGGCSSSSTDPVSADERPLATNRDLAGACANPRTYFPRADAYAGEAPHPITAFRTGFLDSAEEVSSTKWSSNRPQQWLAVDTPRYQLVACLGKAESDGYLRDCAFESGAVPLHRGRYEVTVYEVKTGKEIGRERMRGTGLDGSGDRCPFMVWLDRKMLFTEPDLAEFQRALGKYVDAPLQPEASSTVSAVPRPVTDLSGLCGKLGSALPAAIGSIPLKDSGSQATSQNCVWEGRGADRLFLRVAAQAHPGRSGSTSNSQDLARQIYDISKTTMERFALAPGLEPVPGLGDQATVAHTDGSLLVGTGSNRRTYPGTKASLIVLARNVTLDIGWSGANLDYETAKPEVIALAREVIAQFPR